MDTKALMDAINALLAQYNAAQLPKAPTDAQDTSNRPGNALPGVYTGPTVLVRPTGVRANGVVREWPVVPEGLNQLGYMQWLCTLLRPDGLSYVPAQYRATVSTAISSAGYGRPFGPEEYPWRADCWVYPEDWRTQAQIDQAARDEAAWGVWNKRMQQQWQATLPPDDEVPL